jgi:hypothetical protein
MGRDALSLNLVDLDHFKTAWRDQALAGSGGLDYAALFGTLEERRFPGAVLPYASEGGDVYFAVSSTRREWRELRALLTAYVGRTTSTFNGEPAVLRSSDPVEGLLLRDDIEIVSRFTASGSPLHIAATKSGLRALVNQVLSAPISVSRQLGPLSAKLRELDLSIAAQDKRLAADALRQLTEDPRLDAMNLAYLRIHLLAAFREWKSILDSKDFNRLLGSRRPAVVTSELVDAILWDRVIGTSFGTMDDVESFLSADLGSTTVSEVIDQLLGSGRGGAHSSSVVLSFIREIRARRVDERTIQAVDRLRSDPKFGASAELNQLVTVVESLTPPTVDGRTSREPLLMVPAVGPANLETARALLFRAAQFEAVDFYPQVLGYVERLTVAERAELETSAFASGVLRQIRTLLVGGRLVADWPSWIRALPELSPDQAQAAARDVSALWDARETLSNPAFVTNLAELIWKVPDVAGEQLRCGLPLFVSWLEVSQGGPLTAFKEIYLAAFDRLLADEIVTRSKVELLVRLLDTLLSIGVDAALCRRLLSDIQGQLSQLVSTRTLDPVVDLIETTVTCPCPCPDARRSLWFGVVGNLQSWRDRLEESHRNVLEDIGRMLGETESAQALGGPPAAPIAVAGAASRQLQILLYTLRPGVSDRVAKLLPTISPTVRLETSSALDGESRLRERARAADVVIICWGAATHAATNAIKAAVDSSKIRYPSGNGSSSVIRAINDALTSAA